MYRCWCQISEWDFNRSDFHYFYTIKSLWKGDFGVRIKFFTKIFRGSFGAWEFLTRMLRLILRRTFFEFGPRIFFREAFETIDFRCYRCFKSYFKFLMRKLRPFCAGWTDAHPDHTHQFLTRILSMRISSHIFKMFILYTLSMRVRNWCMLSMHVRNWCISWAYASGTDACTEHMSQELVHALSIRVRNWWGYTSGNNACTERSPFKTCWAYTSGTDAYPEHTHHFLMRILSISVKIPNLKRSPQNMLIMCIRNWWVHLAYASGTDAHDQRAHQK